MLRRWRLLLGGAVAFAAVVAVAWSPLAKSWDAARKRRLIQKFAARGRILEGHEETVCRLLLDYGQMEPVLVQGLRDENCRVRAGCAMVFARSGRIPEAARDMLKGMARKGWIGERIWARCALARAGIDSQKHIAEIGRQVDASDDWQIRNHCGKALFLLGKDSLPALPAMIRHVESQPQLGCHQWLIRAIGAIGPEASPAVPALRQLLRGGTSVPAGARQAAIKALAQIDGAASRKSIPELKTLVSTEKNSTLVLYAKAALIRFGLSGVEDYAEDFAFAMSEEPDPDTAEAAGIAGIAAPETVPLLMARAPRREIATVTRRAIIEALGEMGTAGEEALPVLESIWTDPRECASLRIAARDAFRKIRQQLQTSGAGRRD